LENNYNVYIERDIRRVLTLSSTNVSLLQLTVAISICIHYGMVVTFKKWVTNI